MNAQPGQTLIMAVLNVTPDSFSDGGRLYQTNNPEQHGPVLEAVVQQAEAALSAGAHILDIGGESTRPGATEINPKEETGRVIPAIQAIKQQFPSAFISVDTRKAQVAQEALQAGAEMINDVSGLCFDPTMADVVAQFNAWLVLMHAIGTPQTMQKLAQSPQCYPNGILPAVSEFFEQQIQQALSVGVRQERIILDPGFGFGKTIEDNLTLLKHLDQLTMLGFPLLVGTSRKSFLTLGNPDIPPHEREALTAASLAITIQQGAQIVRVHDVITQKPVVDFCARLAKDNSNR